MTPLPTVTAGPTTDGGSGRRRVRVWFGPHLIDEYRASAAEAAAYASEMPYRFHGVRVSVRDADSDSDLPPLRPKRLWWLTLC